jgi:hypothetical protein
MRYLTTIAAKIPPSRDIWTDVLQIMHGRLVCAWVAYTPAADRTMAEFDYQIDEISIDLRIGKSHC